jgi:hypothetical protein
MSSRQNSLKPARLLRASATVVSFSWPTFVPHRGAWDIKEASGITKALRSSSPFTLQHALACKKGGLVIFRHNEIRDELVNLAGKALTPSAVRDEPLIKPSRVKESEKRMLQSQTPVRRKIVC